MKCKSCDNDLMVANLKMVSERDSTDVFQEQQLICINPKCSCYAGRDLDNPKMIVETIRNKVN